MSEKENDANPAINNISNVNEPQRKDTTEITAASGNQLNITLDVLNSLLQAAQQKNDVKQSVGFPCFNPDQSRIDIHKWCADVDERAKRDNLQSYDIIRRVQTSLMGRAKAWYEKYGYQYYEWIDLRASLVHTFSSGIDIITNLRKVANIESDEFNTYTDFVMEKVAQINQLSFDIPEDKVVRIIVGCISEITVRNSITFVMPTSVQGLIDSLSSIRERPRLKVENQIRRKEDPSSTLRVFKRDAKEIPTTSKRVKSDTEKRCFGCGKLGHVRNQCTQFNAKEDEAAKFSKFANKSVKIITCEFCRNTGHDVSKCWAKQRAERKNVNICATTNPCVRGTPILINGKLFNCLLDTGSDCSLMRSDIAAKLSIQKRTHFLVLQGIGDQSILLTEQFDVIVEFKELTLEVTFHIIGKQYSTNEIIIGRDVLKDASLEIITDVNGSTLRRCTMKAYAASCVVKEWPRLSSDLENVLHKYSEYFIDGFPITAVSTGSLNNRLSKDVNVYHRPYRMAQSERKIVAEIVAELKNHGIVRDSNSPFASPVVLVKKQNGQNRLCVDYRALNSITIKDRYPLPRIDDQLDKLVGNSIFSSLDMASGFHQIPIAADSVEKTAFITPDGQYEYLRMPFGLANAPAVFQRAINAALGELKDTIALVYLDDVLIPTKTAEEGLKNLDLVLATLTKNGFSLNLQKCKFLQTSIEYLGREITADGIRPSKRKIDALVQSPTPTSVKHVRQFMGLANYFRKFVKEFAVKTHCISALLKKDAKFNWSNECESAKQHIIQILTARPVLILFNPELYTELHTDASALGYGAILFQRLDGHLRVVSYYSQATKGYEKNYHSYELETLAVVNAIKHFRHYLLGITFVLVTDCNALKATKQKKDLLPRVARWWIYMQDFNFEITYRKGKTLLHADYLSRNPPRQQCYVVNSVSQSWIQIEQEQDLTTKEIIEKIKSHDTDTLAQYQIKGGILYKKLEGSAKIYLPQSTRLSVMRHFHEDNCHVGWEKTLAKIRENFWMPNMSRNFRKFVDSCLICLVAKRPSGKKQCELHPIQKNAIPFYMVHIDFIGPFDEHIAGEFRYIFILIDAFTKFVILKPCKTLKAVETAQIFQDYVALFGVPNKIISDRGTNFTSEDFKKLCATMGIEHHLIAPGSSRANGQVERYVDTVSNLLRTNAPNSFEWTIYIGRVQLALNTTVNKATGFSPLKLLTGIVGRTPKISALLEGLEIEPIYENVGALRLLAENRLKENAEKMKVRFDSNKKKPEKLQIGQKVVYLSNQIRKTKLQPYYTGPYVVVGVLQNDRYKLKAPHSKNHIVAARDVLKPIMVVDDLS